MGKPPLTFAYVADGKLFLQPAGGESRLIESTFVQGILERIERNRERNDWKSQNMAWQLAPRGINPMLLNQHIGGLRRVRFVGITPGASSNEILYAIETDHASGLFHLEIAEGYERRLYHRNQFKPADLARCPRSGTLALTLRSPDGTSHIATMGAEGKGLKEVTQGDAVDEAPSWSACESNCVYFQSAGVGRNQQGAFIGLSPYVIQKLDLDNNKMEMIIEEDDSDCLLPRKARDGSLYFIRRPYQLHGAPVSIWRFALDALLFPFRLANAIVHFLNSFSLFFSKKPLITAGGPAQEGPDQRMLMLYGRLIDLKKIKQDAKGNDAPALVPASWVLVCRKQGGSESIIAKKVLAYDICNDGGVIYTNGSKVFHVPAAGDPREVARGSLIEKVIALNPQS